MASCTKCGSDKQITRSHYPAKWIRHDARLLLGTTVASRRIILGMHNIAPLCDPCRRIHLKLEQRLMEESLLRLATDMCVLHRNFTKLSPIVSLASIPKIKPEIVTVQKIAEVVESRKKEKATRLCVAGVAPGYWPVVPIAERIKQLGEEAWG